MRTSPLIGRNPWFGPRRLGWGLEPVSMEGWVVTFAFAALTVFVRRRQPDWKWARYGLLGGFLIFAFLKGTTPGGPGARADFDALKVAGSAS